jgi:hypothetical protein
MNARQFTYANALAAAMAFALYIATLFVFVVYDSSDYGRAGGNTLSGYLGGGMRMDLTAFFFYFTYFGLYLGLVTVLTRQGPVGIKVLAGIAAALCVVPLGVTAFWLGFTLGMVLVVVTGILLGITGALFAIPLTGIGVGYAFNGLLVALARWPSDDPAVVVIRRRNVVAAAICACLAGLFVGSQGVESAAPEGWDSIFAESLVGLSCPLIHVGSTLWLLVDLKKAQGAWREPLGGQTQRALVIMVFLVASVIAAAGVATHEASGERLWTAQGLARVFTSPAEVRHRREPPTDLPVRVGNYLVDRHAVDESYYDWRSGRYLDATFLLGSVTVGDRTIDVKLHLDARPMRGLAYICEEPTEGFFAPCRVVEQDKTLRDDPKTIHVGLYQGGSEITRLGRTLMMSCRYSFGICKIEFVEPWYSGLIVALMFDGKEREHWAEIVRFATSEIEKAIRPAN